MRLWLLVLSLLPLALGQAEPVTIAQIQGSGQVSPLVDQTVSGVRGVVTLVRGTGFFMQEVIPDGDPATSDGIFVFLNRPPFLRLGSEVLVSGRVVESRAPTRPRDLPLTQINARSADVQVLGMRPLPAPVVLRDLPDQVIDPDGIAFFERLEGMLVAVPDARVVGPTNFFGEFVVVAPGDARALTPSGHLRLRASDFNPERISVDDNDSIALRQLAVGARVPWLVGALDYTFSNYKIQPQLPPEVVPATSRRRQPLPRRQGFTVASFNVENLFDTVDDRERSDDVPTPAELALKLGKLTLAILGQLGAPDIVVVQEVENQAVLSLLAGALNRALQAPRGLRYAARSLGSSDQRSIEVGFLYRAERVELLDARLATALLPDPAGAFTGTGPFEPGREPLIGRFRLGERELTIIGNHLKSKGGPQFGLLDRTTQEPIAPGSAGDDPLFGMVQPPVLFTEQTRLAQVAYLSELVRLLEAQDPGLLLLVAGDLNDFEFSRSLQVLEAAGLENLMFQVPSSERFTYIFEGNAEVLDHILVNTALHPFVRQAWVAHFNASFPAVLEADPDVAARASDHDPPVVVLRFS
ncbi:MAG: endonuclease/exonuclease/phosphatase family protein [Deinococcus sp.]|nr:endonuclease/exonuclease/phosphatase family protein [Deinococcus sp.]